MNVHMSSSSAPAGKKLNAKLSVQSSSDGVHCNKLAEHHDLAADEIKEMSPIKGSVSDKVTDNVHENDGCKLDDHVINVTRNNMIPITRSDKFKETNRVIKNTDSKPDNHPADIAVNKDVSLIRNSTNGASMRRLFIPIIVPSNNKLEASIFAGTANVTTSRKIKADSTNIYNKLDKENPVTAMEFLKRDAGKECRMGLVQWREIDDHDDYKTDGLSPHEYSYQCNSSVSPDKSNTYICPCCVSHQQFPPTYQGYQGCQPIAPVMQAPVPAIVPTQMQPPVQVPMPVPMQVPMSIPSYQYQYPNQQSNCSCCDYGPPAYTYQYQQPVCSNQSNDLNSFPVNYYPHMIGPNQWGNIPVASDSWMCPCKRCCQSPDDYYDRGSRRFRRYKKEYYFLPPKNRCQGYDHKSRGIEIEKETKRRMAEMSKSLESPEQSEPLLPSGAPLRPIRIEESEEETSPPLDTEDSEFPELVTPDDLKNESKNTSTPPFTRSPQQSTTTKTPASTTPVTTKPTRTWPTHFPIGFRLQKLSVSAPLNDDDSSTSLIFDQQILNSVKSENDVTQINQESTKLSEDQPNVAETVASVLRKRHNEILKQELQDMLEHGVRNWSNM